MSDLGRSGEERPTTGDHWRYLWLGVLASLLLLVLLSGVDGTLVIFLAIVLLAVAAGGLVVLLKGRRS